MARALTFSGKSSQLNVEYFPAIDLSDGDYVCGLVDFQTFNTIPNIDETNHFLYFGYEDLTFSEIGDNDNEIIEYNDNYDDDDGDDDDVDEDDSDNTNKRGSEGGGDIEENMLPYSIESEQRSKRATGIVKRKIPIVKRKQRLTSIQIPTGSYEVNDLYKYLKKMLRRQNVELLLKANKNTLQCEIMCSQPIDFTKSNSIGPLLGFRVGQILERNTVHVSELPADILKVNVIRVECSIVKGSYLNGEPSHTIHEFSPRVAPGYKIIEVPQNVIYFPVTVKNIHSISLSIVDQQNRPINFRGETITIRIHIKKVL